jgi:hypothetical protein
MREGRGEAIGSPQYRVGKSRLHIFQLLFKAHIRKWIYSTSELRCSSNASQAVSLPSHLIRTVVGVAKSQRILLFNSST